jgi:Arc/MetJ-type ribon-helix-helix transcriptional regulator
LRRSGISPATIRSARTEADVRAEASRSSYDKGPKRFVVQEVIKRIEVHKDADRFFSAFVTSLTKGEFPNASDSARESINRLKSRIATDKAEVKRIQREKAAEKTALANTKAKRLEEARLQRERSREALHDEFLSLMSEKDVRKRGFLLEPFLVRFFEFFDLNPRKSFRLTGEQIDGSLIWRDHSNLVEAKWALPESVAGKDFGAFDYKIGGKTADTRGLFVSINS